MSAVLSLCLPYAGRVKQNKQNLQFFFARMITLLSSHLIWKAQNVQQPSINHRAHTCSCTIKHFNQEIFFRVGMVQKQVKHLPICHSISRTFFFFIGFFFVCVYWLHSIRDMPHQYFTAWISQMYIGRNAMLYHKSTKVNVTRVRTRCCITWLPFKQANPEP